MKRIVYTVVALCSVYAIGQNSSVTIKDVAMGNSDLLVEIGLENAQRQPVAQGLNNLLANEYALYTKTLKFHWNVEGPFFGPLHTLFREQYEALFEVIDVAAERVRALGFKAYGSLAEFIENSTISEDPGKNPEAVTMVKTLLDDHHTVIKQIRGLIDLTVEHNDMGSNNFLCDLIEKHEKMAWMLRAHLLGS